MRKTIFHALALFWMYDQLDVPALAGAKYLPRRAIQVQRAVKWNPKSLSFQWLEKMCDHAQDEGQGLATQVFTKQFSEVSDADTRIMRHQRLLRSELRAQGCGQPSRQRTRTKRWRIQ